ncbi:unnamed protein product [Closterium sp. NIES-54]
MVTTTTPRGQRVLICTCTWTRHHLATFTRPPGSSMYTLATEPPQVAASAQVSTSGQVGASCLCRLLSHQTLLWHHRLGHPSLPRLRGMHSRLLVSGLPRSLPPLQPSPAPPCLPCVEGRQRAAPHSSSFPLTTAPLQTLHMDVWGPAHQFGQDLRVLRLHSDRGGEFSSDFLRDFCRGEGILQSFTTPPPTAIAATATAATAAPATAAPEYCATMAWLRVLEFDHEGRPVAFDTWHDDLQLYLLSDINDSVSLFDHVSGVALAPPATADGLTRSEWLSRDSTARLAIHNHLSVAECTQFGQHRTEQALYNAIVAHYSSPTTVALGRLLLPYLFPELLAFTIVANLVTHLRTSDARYRNTVPAEFLATNQPPMFITLHFILYRLPDSLRSVRDHFLSLDPTSLTVDLLEQHLLVAETSAVAVGAARGTSRLPFFEGCSPSPLSPSFASAAAPDVSVSEDVSAASTSAKRRSSKGKGGRGGGGDSGGGGGGSGSGGGGSSGGGGGSGGSGVGGTGGGSRGSGGGGGGSGGSGGSGGGGSGGGRPGPRRGGPGGGQRQHQQRRSETQTPQQLREWLVQRGTGGGSETCPYVIRTGVRAGQTCGKFHTEHRCFSRLDDAWRAEFGDDVERPRWAELLRSGVAIFDLDYDAIISAMYALSFSAEGDCYRCVPPNPSIAAVALGASASGTPPGTSPVKALHTFTLDSGASRCFFRDSTTLTPLPASVPVRLADPSGGPVVASSSTVLPCPAVPSSSLSGLHLPSFSTNLVSTTALQDAMVTTTTPGGQRVSICTCTWTGRHLATFTRRPGSSLYTLATEPPQVAAFAQVSMSGKVAASCSCRLLWHHRLGHPSLPRLRGMHSRFLVSGLPRSLPPLPPSPAPPCLPCVEGRQRAAPHSSSLPLMSAPLETLHMDVWGPARVNGQGREQYFLLVVDDYTWYTTIFPLRSKGDVVDVLIPWILIVRLQLLERFGMDLSVLRLHSNRGGEFSSDLLRDFCRGEGILQSFTLPASPQQNGIAERRIGLVMEVTRTSMIHAAAPHFLWLFAVRYAAHQLNLWPRVSLPETSPTLRWTGKVGDASVFRGPAPSGVSHVDPLLGTAPIHVAVGSGAAPGAASGGAEPGDVGSEGAGSGGAEPGGAEPGGVELEGAESGGAAPWVAASSGGPAGASLRLSLQQLREWLVRRAHRRSGAPGAGGARDTGAGGAALTTRAGAAGSGGVGCAGAGDPTEPGAAGTGGVGAGGPGVGGPGAKGARAARAGVGGTGAGGTGAAGAGVVDPGAGGAGGTVRPRPYFVPLLQQVLGVPSSTGLPPPFLCPLLDQSQLPLQPASPLPAPSPYTEQFGGLTERREPASCPVSHCSSRSSLVSSSCPWHARYGTPARAASPTVSRLLATALIDPSFESAAASALVAELLDFAAACRLDYTTALVAESVSASPPSVGAAMDAEMASWKSRGTYVDEVPPSRANIVDGMWIFRVKRPSGSPPSFKARYVARGFCQRHGVDYFQTFSPTPKMTTPRVLLHVAAQRDYELHSLDFSTAFLQGSLHEEIWLHRPPDFTRTIPAGTQWSLRQQVYSLRQAPREWHDTLRTTLAALGFAPSTADPLLFLRTDTSLPPIYVLVYVDDLVFATADTEALTLVNSELQKRHPYTDLGEPRNYLGHVEGRWLVLALGAVVAVRHQTLASHIPSRPMASRHLVLLGLVLAVVCIGSADAKIITVGQGTDIWTFLSPWAYGVSSWKQPTVVAGDVLVFRWIGMRNVRQWATPLGYTACWFGSDALSFPPPFLCSSLGFALTACILSFPLPSPLMRFPSGDTDLFLFALSLSLSSSLSLFPSPLFSLSPPPLSLPLFPSLSSSFFPFPSPLPFLSFLFIFVIGELDIDRPRRSLSSLSLPSLERSRLFLLSPPLPFPKCPWLLLVPAAFPKCPRLFLSDREGDEGDEDLEENEEEGEEDGEE